MHGVLNYQVSCPYCGESFEALIDSSQADSQYTEDCFVCCQPIIFHCQSDEVGEITVSTYSENEAF